MEQCVVDNRVFLLGLDALYRKAMKRHERSELLVCARAVAAALTISPADVPVEGYYGEDAALTEYFRLLRALQATDGRRVSAVATLPAFLRLKQVAAAPLFGRAADEGLLLPVGQDSLSLALRATRPQWTIGALTTAASAAARAENDFSLVGLAARTEDAVVLTALRESVVLYAQWVLLATPHRQVFVWAVDDDLGSSAQVFIDTFNDVFGEHLPAAVPDHAEWFWNAHEDENVLGRCVRLGHDDTRRPIRHYHWAICRASDGGLIVHDFWDDDVWTTKSYRARLPPGESRPDLSAGKDPGYNDIRL